LKCRFRHFFSLCKKTSMSVINLTADGRISSSFRDVTSMDRTVYDLKAKFFLHIVAHL
jgi:hypothetical protein